MLNPDLYNRLKRKLGAVKVLREDERAVLRPYRVGTTIEMRPEGGEEYNVCCPFCHDTGFHLYINYTYGLKNTKGERSFATAHCFHGCLEDTEKREALYELLFAFSMPRHIKSSVAVFAEEPAAPAEIIPPGKLVLVSQLPDNHPAVEYLCNQRKFSKSLLDYYGICYCYESQTNPLAVGRIVIPIWFKNEYKGWQTRKLGDGKAGGIKYCTAPGMRKSKLIYNYDMAIKQDYVVICEGVTDVWRVGSAGVCLFGKKASVEQIRLIKDGWRDKDICLLLDPDASKESAALYENLRVDCKNVSVVKLPEGVKDAALMEEEALRRLIDEARRESKNDSGSSSQICSDGGSPP